MSSKKNLKEEALHYHAKGRPGKIEVIPTKEYANQRDLSLAYSPGVAEPCLAIQANPDDAYKYTAKGNLVAVISNGTAVLGLGDIGAVAGKPVMEGKGLLFKIFADIDVFDIELDTTDVDEFVRTVKILEPTFGGVNLEDISAPACFEIEERLKKELNIPIMHDDQHGTAIISSAALLNATELVGKDLSNVKIIVNGAGASAISCSRLYIALGAKKENLYMFDSKGLIHPSRTNLDGKKIEFANAGMPAETTLEEAMKGADVFVGLSKGNVVNQDMVKSMAKNCIIFALANPTPEISYEEAMAAREDIIMATGRSDYPNQVNNVLGFPFIFRGALDVRASEINEEMKLAAVRALAELAKKPVPDLVNLAYDEVNLHFGKNYIIPKPVDPRLITTVSPAVAKAAMETGVAKEPITDWEAYEHQLTKRLGQDNTLTRVIMTKAQKNPKRVVYADAENVTVLKAIQQVVEDKIAIPVLLGNKETIRAIVAENNIRLSEEIEIIDPRNPSNAEEEQRLKDFSDYLFEKRQRKGLTFQDARDLVRRRTYYGALMVEHGLVDTMIGGMTRNYPDTIKPALQVIGRAEGVNKIFGMYILMSRFGPLFLADTTVNFDPEVEDLVQIAEITSDMVKQLNIKPRIAFLTYSNFGSVPNGPAPMRLRKAVDILRKKHPDMIVDGEMQAHLAFDTELLKEHHPFSSLADGPANVLIFPNLSSANIAYNLLKEVAGIEKVGPLLLGLKKPIQVLQLGATVREIVNLTAISVLETLKPE
ncbi:allosteric NADP-dependent malic enzyme [Leadbetterella byssophila DSM 17132]|uniref:Allosteric NADP-dependent malic enzyme n=1 Tax=Leadbetterella byssophila (strain DSM 17132 / JCM 16389 / KACC 11308 / NBRC 106382 / 4M15) TaxID=649349 RepID=E4RYS3_LEAB4|nr:NADP-dependent malic enzyme [Leadbetterella byssophila]ADQ16435.1 allosteric NADP-dependent malic enzyme [Leadbetterella byssophila DSM 17132]